LVAFEIRTGSKIIKQLRLVSIFNGRRRMAKTSRLTQAAEKIGGAMGRADRTAHKVAKAGAVAKEELEAISKQVEALKRQLQKTTKRIRHALG
jgi:seryl-tRNA synthetase